MNQTQTVNCGSCGCDTAKIHAEVFNDGAVGFRKLIITCTGCGERTNIQVQPARIELEPHSDEQSGAFCAGWGAR